MLETGLHDLMAEQPVKLMLVGELGAVDGFLYLRSSRGNKWRRAAWAVNYKDADACLAALLHRVT